MSTMIRRFICSMPMLLAWTHVAAACACGPDFCMDDSRIAPKLAAKKKELSKEYPQRLVSLLDRGTQCVARIGREPDGFSLWLVNSDGSKQTLPWAQDAEDLARKQLGKELKRYWVINAQRAFSCCGEPNYDAMNDYDAADDVNASRALKCVAGSSC